MRRALISLDAHAALHHPGLEEATDDLEQALVADAGHPAAHGAVGTPAPRQTSHQDVVVDPVEKLFQVEVHDDLAAVGDVALGLGERLMGALPRAEAEA